MFSEVTEGSASRKKGREKSMKVRAKAKDEKLKMKDLEIKQLKKLLLKKNKKIGQLEEKKRKIPRLEEKKREKTKGKKN